MFEMRRAFWSGAFALCLAADNAFNRIGQKFIVFVRFNRWKQRPRYSVASSMRNGPVRDAERQSVVTMAHSEDFELLDVLSSNSKYAEFRVFVNGMTTPLRMLRFEIEVSSSTSFRAAFRKDMPVLCRDRHPNILSVLESSETDGRLLYISELPAGQPLNELLANRQLLWDEVTDVAWQIASAIQHAHNIGLVHGALRPESIIVSEGLRVKVADFCVNRWLEEAESSSQPSPVIDPAVDLRSFGMILQLLVDQLPVEDANAHSEPMRQLVHELHAPDNELIARDVQGRLGNMLLVESGDSIEMVDARSGQYLHGRSLVDELFDEPPARPQPEIQTHALSSASDRSATALTVLCVVALVLLALIIWLSG